MEIVNIIDEYQSLKKKTQEILGKDYEVEDIRTIYIYAMDTHFFIQAKKSGQPVNIYICVENNWVSIKANFRGDLSQETKKELINLFTDKQ